MPMANHVHDEAVSPIIGTILMVAITVIFAGSAFVIVSMLAKSPDPPPSLTFYHDDRNSLVTLVVVRGDYRWSEFELTMSVDGDFNFGKVEPGPNAIVAEIFVAVGGAPNGPADKAMHDGDSIAFCADPGPQQLVSVRIRHTASDGLIYQRVFPQIQACPS